MRKITGEYLGRRCTVIDYGHGKIVECSTILLAQLVDADGNMPQGTALYERCQAVFGVTMQLEIEDPAGGWGRT